jgi:ABC-type nitrate/sulfonate/bicarbonate transport system substrate-binding protein
MSDRDLVPVRAGFIPLTDAAVLIAAADRGFAEREGIALDLVRDVSWANVRDRLLLGDFQVAHLLAPISIAANLGLGYPPVPIVVPAALGLNGSAIIVSNALHAELAALAEGNLADPTVSGAALARVVADRKRVGAEPLTFASVFPFSTHNYLLRFWMAAAGIDPDEDIRLVVVPPPYMVDSLSLGHVAGMCVGAPWPSVGVAAGLGHILHFGSEIVATAPDKVLAVRGKWQAANPDAAERLLRAVIRSALWCATPENRSELADILAEPNRLGVSAGVIRHALDGRLIVTPDGGVRDDPRYFWMDLDPAIRPLPAHAAWLYAQMVRWRQAPLSATALATAAGAYRSDLFEAALASLGASKAPPGDRLGAFAGPRFDPADIAGHLAAWSIGARN